MCPADSWSTGLFTVLCSCLRNLPPCGCSKSWMEWFMQSLDTCKEHYTFKHHQFIRKDNCHKCWKCSNIVCGSHQSRIDKGRLESVVIWVITLGFGKSFQLLSILKWNKKLFELEMFHLQQLLKERLKNTSIKDNLNVIWSNNWCEMLQLEAHEIIRK